jgi:S1-C subfamily serine protease
VFDAHDDIAILTVPGLSARPLKMVPSPKSGTSAAILGFPLDGPFNAEAGRLGSTQNVNTEDAYGDGPVERSIASLRGKVRPGNSGGPMVDSSGNVVATVFAAITNGGGHGPGGFAVPNALVKQELGAAASHGGHVVGTGHCAG